MAITGIDTIEGKQIIAAGAVSAKSAEMAYNDENGNPITGYQLAGEYYSASNPSGFITGVDLTPYQTTAEMTAYQPAGDYLTTADSAEFYTTANESGFITNDAITGKQDVTGMTAYQPVGEYYSASNPSGFITGVDLSDYATTAELADKQDITGMTAYQPVGNYQPAGDYLTTADSANFYTTANESGFITGVDLTPYQLTADMTAYQSAGDYLTTADSGNFYPMTGNPSGFIKELPEEEEVEFEEIDLADYQPVSSMTAYANSADVTGTAQYGLTTAGWSEITAGGGEVPEGIMVESGLEYDANNKISGYSGSAFAGGVPAETSGLWQSASETVTANSGAWGGSALPISAGPGIKFEMVDNTLIASVDETVLWTGSVSTTGVTCNLNDAFSSYNTIKVYSRVKASSADRSDCIKEITWPEGSDYMYAYVPMDNIASNTHTEEVMYISASQSAFSLLAGWRLVGVTQTTGVTSYNFSINKVVGINRIAGGN